MRTTLPVLVGGELCEGCGRCCDKIGLPPFEVPNPDMGPLPVDPAKRAWGYDSYTSQQLTDTDTFARMPAALRAEHAGLVRGLTADPSETPCAWLDTDTRRCRHYDHRPAVCRDWEPGEEYCLQTRKGRGTVVWRSDNAPANWRNPRRERLTPWEAARSRLVPLRWQMRLARSRGPVRAAALLLLAAVIAPRVVVTTVREFRRGWLAVRDLWASPATELPSKRR